MKLAKFFDVGSTPAPEHEGLRTTARFRLTDEKACLDFPQPTPSEGSQFPTQKAFEVFSGRPPNKFQQPLASLIVGPARILATESRRDAVGQLIEGSSIWLVRGRRLLKCCREQLRRASDREQIIEELRSETSQPWTFPQVAAELGGNEDWSEQPDMKRND